MGDKQPDSPAQKRGKEIHAILEKYLLTGVIDQTHPLGYHRYIEWLLDDLPDPNKERIAAESRIFLDTETGAAIGGYDDGVGIPLVGVVDVGMYDRKMLEIGDLKTVTDFRRAKTPAELHQDTQMNTYANWAFAIDEELDVVKVTHYYVLVSSGVDKDGNPKKAVMKPKSKKTLVVSVEISRESAAAVWERDLAVMEEMKVAALVDTFEDLTPGVNFCEEYGGCDYKEKCGIRGKEKLFVNLKPKKERQLDMGFMDKLNKAKKNQGKDEEEVDEPKTKAKPKPKPKAKVKAKPKKEEKPAAKSKFSGKFGKKSKAKEVEEEEEEIEEEEIEEEEEEEEEEEKKVAAKSKFSGKFGKGKTASKTKTSKSKSTKAKPSRKVTPKDEEEVDLLPPDGADRETSEEESEEIRSTAAEKLEKKKAAAAKKKASPRKAKSKRGFTLYIGCMPAKGEHTGAVLIEDWTGPIIEELNEYVKEATGHRHYSLTGFNEKDVALGGAISAYIEENGLPDAIVISGYNHATDFLIPHATDVVRAIGK
jgi:hypothetical protein